MFVEICVNSLVWDDKLKIPVCTALQSQLNAARSFNPFPAGVLENQNNQFIISGVIFAKTRFNPFPVTKSLFSAFNSFCQIRTYISKKINKALWYFYGPWENFFIAHKGMLTILRPLPSTLLIVSHVRLQSLLYSWHLSLKHFFSCCPHKVSIHCIIFFSFSFLSGFPQLFIKQFGFMFSWYYQCFRHPGVKRSIFSGRIYIFFREWTFETVINWHKKMLEWMLFSHVPFKAFPGEDIFFYLWELSDSDFSYYCLCSIYHFFLQKPQLRMINCQREKQDYLHNQ